MLSMHERTPYQETAKQAAQCIHYVGYKIINMMQEIANDDTCDSSYIISNNLHSLRYSDCHLLELETKLDTFQHTLLLRSIEQVAGTPISQQEIEVSIPLHADIDSALLIKRCDINGLIGEKVYPPTERGLVNLMHDITQFIKIQAFLTTSQSDL